MITLIQSPFLEYKLTILRNKKTPFIIHHMQGNPKTMQIKPKYKNVLLDIYDFFQKKILELETKLKIEAEKICMMNHLITQLFRDQKVHILKFSRNNFLI